MPFIKGQPKHPDSGTKVGQKYAPTIRKDELRAKFHSMEDRIFSYAEGLPPDKLVKFYIEIKEYFDPKLSRVENKQDGPVIINLKGMSRAEIEKLAK